MKHALALSRFLSCSYMLLGSWQCMRLATRHMLLRGVNKASSA